MAPRVSPETVARMVELHQAGVGVSRITKVCGVSWPTVCSHLRRVGVMPPAVPAVGRRTIKLDPAAVERAISVYRTGRIGIRRTGELLGISYSSARDLLVARGVKINRQGQLRPSGDGA